MKKLVTASGSAYELARIGYPHSVIQTTTGVRREDRTKAAFERPVGPLEQWEWRVSLTWALVRFRVRPTCDFAADLNGLARVMRTSAIAQQRPADKTDAEWLAAAQEHVWLTGHARRKLFSLGRLTRLDSLPRRR